MWLYVAYISLFAVSAIYIWLAYLKVASLILASEAK